MLALSASGETEEILRLLATIKRLQVPLISMTGDEVFEQKDAGESPATTQATHHTKPQPHQPGEISRPWRLRPMLLSIARWTRKPARWVWRRRFDHGHAGSGRRAGDGALEKRGFKEEDFANLHPGRKTGKTLARVESLMHTGEAVPRVAPQTKMPDVIYEMSRKKLGMTAVVDGEKLVGVISDGDLRRLLEKRGKDVLDLTASECMTAKPRTIGANEFAATALALMEEKKITSLVVVDGRASYRESFICTICGERR